MEQVNEVEQVDETGHIDTTGGMIYFHEILDQFQIDKGIVHLSRNHKKSILEIQTKEMLDDDVIENNKKEKKNQPVSSNTETKETEAAMFTTAPRTILFPKFCELIVRLILKKYPSGKLILTETEVKKRKDSLKGKRRVYLSENFGYIYQNLPPNNSCNTLVIVYLSVNSFFSENHTFQTNPNSVY